MIDRLEIQRLANDLRLKWGVSLNKPIDIFDLSLTDENLTLVKAKMAKAISGMCVKKANLIAINTNTTIGHQNVSLAHELYHLYYDENNLSEITSFGLDTYEQKSLNERKADLFASHLLIPDQELQRYIYDLNVK